MSTHNLCCCWSELPNDLLVSIAKRLQFMEDFVAFRGVCVSWRSAATKDYCNRSLPKIPILMLAEKSDSNDREFFSLSRNKMWFKMALPETKGKKCVESKGWFITVGWEGEMHLLHPFSRVQIELPNIRTSKNYDESPNTFDKEPHRFLYVAELSCSPFESSDYVLMIAGAGLGLDFWRPGDKVWTTIDIGFTCLFSDITFFNGQFYTINHASKIRVCDISSSCVPSLRDIFEIDNRELRRYRKMYLVESFGELLVVFRNGRDLQQEGDDDDDNNDDDGEGDGEYYYNEVTRFDVVRVHLNKSQGAWTSVKSLGDKSLFVGHSSSFSLDANWFEGTMIKPNCIYFTDDNYEAYPFVPQGGGKDIGIYRLEDGQIERLSDFQSFSKIGPPVFISPYF